MVQEAFQTPEQAQPTSGEPASVGDRAIVSVAFPRADFNRVTLHAAQSKKKTSEFIREAALNASAGNGAAVQFSLTTGSAATIMMSGNVPTTTYAPGTWRHSFDDRMMQTY
jgi:hypothetical protein